MYLKVMADEVVQSKQFFLSSSIDSLCSAWAVTIDSTTEV